jgi:hypothetical protein
MEEDQQLSICIAPVPNLRATLRVVSPFPAEHYPKMLAWLNEFPQMGNDGTPRTLEQVAAIGEGYQGMSYAVMAGDTPVGAIWGEAMGDDMYLGHLVFDATLDAADKARMARAVVTQWFRDGARKIVWQTYPENLRFVNFLKKRLGAQQEGLFRKAHRRGGELADVILLASFPEDLA